MKRILTLLLVLILCLSCAGIAEEKSGISVGDRGKEVLEIKLRLKELRYISEKKVTNQYTDKTEESVRLFQKLNGLPETGIVDDATREVLFSGTAVLKPHDTLPPLATPAPTPVPDWPERDGEGFLQDEGEYVYENDEEGLWIYLSRTLQVVITAHEDSSIPLEWFETDIRTRDGESFYSVQTNPERPGKQFQYPYVIARQAGCVLGFSDDCFAARIAGKETVGIIIRDGKIISGKSNQKRGTHLPNLDMMAQYPDGSLAVYKCNEIMAEELLEKGAVNVFSFGPILVRDGEIDELVYKGFRSTEPRQALGMIEPGHYLLLSVQGRHKESKGTMLQRVAEMMKERGAQQALNIDGGNTMALVFRGRMLNKLATWKNKKFVRTVTSIIGIGHTELPPE